MILVNVETLRTMLNKKLFQCTRTLSRRNLHYGGAILNSLANRADIRPQGGSVPFVKSEKTKWVLPRIAFGSDDFGKPFDERETVLFSAVVNRNSNMMLVNGDSLLSRFVYGSEVYTSDRSEGYWEARALYNIISSGWVRRDEFVLSASLSLGPQKFLPEARSITIEDIPERVKTVLSSLGSNKLDVLFVHLPSEEAYTSEQSLVDLFTKLETLVGEGYLQHYVLGSDSIVLTNATTPLTAHATHPLPAKALPLDAILRARTRVKGLAQQVRSDHKGSLGNTENATPYGSPVFDVTVAQEAEKTLDALSAESHLLGLSYKVSLLSLSHTMRAYSKDDVHAALGMGVASGVGSGLPSTSEKETVSLAEIIRAQGLLQFGMQPLDCVVGDKPFRCITTHNRLLTAHPDVALSLLNDTINFAIHLENLWDTNLQSKAMAQESNQVGADTIDREARAHQQMQALVRSDAQSKEGSLALLHSAVNREAWNCPPRVHSLTKSDTAWARILAAQLNELTTLLEWQFVHVRKVRPALARVLAATADIDVAREWRSGYSLVMHDLTRKLERMFEQEHSGKAGMVLQYLAEQFSQVRKEMEAANGQGALPSPFFNSADLANVTLRLLLSKHCGVDVILSETPQAFGLGIGASQAQSSQELTEHEKALATFEQDFLPKSQLVTAESIENVATDEEFAEALRSVKKKGNANLPAFFGVVDSGLGTVLMSENPPFPSKDDVLEYYKQKVESR